MDRIVSLLPSATEILCALGLEARLVGRSHECDHPPGVERLPVCTAPRFAAVGTSAEIDSRVRGLVRDGLSLYEVDTERLHALAPGLIVTQDQCAVCAASLADVERALAETLGQACRVLSLHPQTLGDVFEDLRRVARAAGVPERGEALAARLTGRVSEIGERAGSLARSGVLCLEWLDPPMGAGHWLPELVALAGGRALAAGTGQRSERLGSETLSAADLDAHWLVVQPCGFDLERTRAEWRALATRPPLAELRAVRAGRVALVDGNAYMNRPGPRLVESLEILAEILHPEVFEFGHEGTGFVRVTRSA